VAANNYRKLTGSVFKPAADADPTLGAPCRAKRSRAQPPAPERRAVNPPPGLRVLTPKEEDNMRCAIVPLSFAASLALGSAVALAQSSSGGGAASSGGGAASSGGASAGAGAAAGSGGTAPSSVGPTSSPALSSGPAPSSAAAPPGSVSPTTGDTTAGSAIPRARSGSETGAGQPGEGTARPTGTNITGTISGRAQGTAPPERVRQQNERDRGIDRNLLSGGGICDGCETGNRPAPEATR
jgi:hypothetical protein